MPLAIQVKKADIGYGNFSVLKEISLKVQKGDFCIVVGPNGSGKSSLMKAILGIEPLRGGDIFLNGTSVSAFREWDLIGYVPQVSAMTHPLFPATVQDIVHMGISKKTMSRAKDMMDLFGLGPIAGRLIGELSGGQYQRVLLARAFAAQREIVFLDEPNTGLEPRIRMDFHKELERLQKEEGLTIFYVTHNLSEVHDCATQLIYVDRKIVFNGSLKDFCLSDDAGSHFGSHVQHTICHQHRH